MQKIIFEGDALEVIHALRREGTWRGSYGLVIEEAKRNLRHLQEWRVNHVNREANVTAHKLAKYAVISKEERL